MHSFANTYANPVNAFRGGAFRVLFACATILTVPLSHITAVLEVASALIFLPFSGKLTFVYPDYASV